MRKLTTTLALVMMMGACMNTAIAADKALPGCSDAAYRAMDFQLGDWILTDAEGKPGGHIRNTLGLGGCTVEEDYTDKGGYHGQSTSAYDAGTKTWQQYWRTNFGYTLFLHDGRREGDRLTMRGEHVDRKSGTLQQHRFTWFVGKDGKVSRQLWEISEDGTHWSARFDATYRAAK